MAATNLFKDVPLIPTDHVFHVNSCYQKDTSPDKVNLGVGGKQLPGQNRIRFQLCFVSRSLLEGFFRSKLRL